MSETDQGDARAAVHVLPIDDVIVHEDQASCPCGPVVERGPYDEVIVVHRALDGRDSGDRDPYRPH